MSNVSKANSQMATKWADQRREMIERAKKKKEESKYGLALNGEMALASDVTPSYLKRNSHTPMTPMSAMDEPGPRRTYMNERPVTHEEMSHVKDSLRLLKSKMRNGSRQSLGLNESKNSRGGGNHYESEDETYKPNKIHSYQNISDNEPSSRRQATGLGGPPSGTQGNYRKVFHPGAKRDSEDEIGGGRGGGFDNNPFGGSKNEDFGGPRRNMGTERNAVNSKQQSSRTRGDQFQQEENKMASMKGAPKPPLANTRGKGAAGGGFGGRNDDYNNDPWGQPQDEYKPDPPANKRPPPKQAKSGYEPSNNDYDNKPPARPAPASRNTPVNRGKNKDADKPAFIQGKFEEDDDRPAVAAQPINFNRVQAQGTEYNEYDNEPKYECPEGCGRKFVEAALEKHVNICKKVFQTKRKAFDSKSMRVVDEQQEQAMKKGEIRETRQEAVSKKTQSNFPANKKAKWKQQSEAFRANMKAARGEQVSVAEQQVLQAAADEGLIRCDCCGRKFNEKAAQRHIPFCQQKSKMDSIKQAPGAKKPMPTSNNNTYSKSRR